MTSTELRVPSTEIARVWRLVAAVLLLAASVGAQQPPADTTSNYSVQQSVEFGGRIVSQDGSLPLFNTFVDMHSGPRLLEQSLELRARDHHGSLFDSFLVRGSGYGGDPNSLTLLRAKKERWYNFDGTFRRSRNYWDFDLFANPLNPANSSPSVPINSSPHSLDAVRHMTDLGLTLAPQSPVRVRAGYARNELTGPALTTVHEGVPLGTELLVFSPLHSIEDEFRVGADIRRLVPRTSLSYDQTWMRIRDRESAADRTFGFQLSNGTPFDLGLVFNTLAGLPCSRPIPSPTAPTTASQVCSGATAYGSTGTTSSLFPTEQFSFESNYWRRLELSGRATYSAADLRQPALDEAFAGFLALTAQRQITSRAVARAQRVAASADFGASWDVTERLRIHESFRFAQFRVPGQTALTSASLFAASALLTPVTFNPATCPAPFNGPGCPTHASLSPADSAQYSFSRFLGQTSENNDLELEYDFGTRAGAHIGHRFRHRIIDQRTADAANLLFFPTLARRDGCSTQPLQPDGSCLLATFTNAVSDTSSDEHTFVAGAWLRPRDALRMNGSFEIGTANRAFTRISPRATRRGRLDAKWRPAPWADIGAMFLGARQTNDAADVNARQEQRDISVTALLAPAGATAWGLDVEYDYATASALAAICYSTSLPSGTACPTQTGLRATTSYYNEISHFGSFAFRWSRWKRLALQTGLNVAQSDGDTTLLNPLASPASLRSRYTRPSAALAVNIAPQITAKAAWGLFRYREDETVGPTLPRDFLANAVTLSVVYRLNAK